MKERRDFGRGEYHGDFNSIAPSDAGALLLCTMRDDSYHGVRVG